MEVLFNLLLSVTDVEPKPNWGSGMRSSTGTASFEKFHRYGCGKVVDLSVECSFCRGFPGLLS